VKTKFIEATDATRFNWGKFMICRFDDEWTYRSALPEAHESRLLIRCGWSADHLLVVDVQTGEGAIFFPPGSASDDLNDKHQIWVCPMFEPFLNWLYLQDVTDLDALPALVNLGNVPTSFSGYRRTRKTGRNGKS
jgi:hypothetical protein